MKKAKILMAIATLLFFSALAYTNWTVTKEPTHKANKYIDSMEEIEAIPKENASIE